MIPRLIARLLLVLSLVLPVSVLAQETATPPDYKAWESVASNAEDLLAKGSATNDALSELRITLVDWRTVFSEAQAAEDPRVQTVKAQIAALGPVPGEGEAEDPAIAERRKELNETLAKLQAPGIAAGEALSRANALISGIDGTLRTRQTDKLMRLSPSPANPVNWPAAFMLGSGIVSAVYAELTAQVTGADAFRELKDNAPVIVALAFVALVLIARGRRWMEQFEQFLLRKSQNRGRHVQATISSLLQIILPLIGVFALLGALEMSGLLGSAAVEIVAIASSVALILLSAFWLGGRLFPKQNVEDAPLALLAERRAEGRFLTVMLGLMLGLRWAVGALIELRAEAVLRAQQPAEDVAHLVDAAISVINFPLIAVTALLVFRLGQLLRRHRNNVIEAGREPGVQERFVGLVGTATLFAAVIAPMLALIGYVSAANALIWPLLMSLWLLGLLLVLQKFMGELYVLAIRGDDSARDSLVPVLAGFLLVLAALPLFALIWGARVEDLVELWGKFRSGLSVGGVQISPGSFITFAVVFAVGYMATRLVQGALKGSVLPKTRIDKGGQNAIVSGLGYMGIFLAAVVAISAAGIDLSSLAIVAGALSVGIGFGLQTIVQNFVSGIILLIERPITEGDWIEVGGQMGIVKAISVRSTRIETFDRSEVIIPNADLIAGQVTNWTRGNVMGRLIIPVGVAYGTNTRRVEKILLDIAENHPLVMMNPEPSVLFIGFGADSLNFEIRVILSDVNFKNRVMSEINHQISERFTEENIEIPFAQRDVWLRNPEALSAQNKTILAGVEDEEGADDNGTDDDS
ncbi:DUF3772 domain-containing protein [Thioclava sp. A2]|uniref:DUF3772 domain-containing protein n=1 Tax=Thioclava sp. FCG-A2 TaxID=3080562 RepID=UPI002954C65F|nr:DUF3772 domain-containing protein [Thioclava sp. A2]MDV7270697.1 DUF3772 domain-containing protein [Thioclava sp. A2]